MLLMITQIASPAHDISVYDVLDQANFLRGREYSVVFRRVEFSRRKTFVSIRLRILANFRGELVPVDGACIIYGTSRVSCHFSTASSDEYLGGVIGTFTTDGKYDWVRLINRY